MRRRAPLDALPHFLEAIAADPALAIAHDAGLTYGYLASQSARVNAVRARRPCLRSATESAGSAREILADRDVYSSSFTKRLPTGAAC
jgi:hypothetical protein